MLTYVCMAWHNARWDEHALHNQPFALTSSRFDTPMPLFLSQGSMSAAARDMLNKAWPGKSILWF